MLSAPCLVPTNHHAGRAVLHVHFAELLVGSSSDDFCHLLAGRSVVVLVRVRSSLRSVCRLVCHRGMRLQIIKINVAKGRLFVRCDAVLICLVVFALATRLDYGDVISCLPIMLIVVVVHLIASLTLDRTEADLR